MVYITVVERGITNQTRVQHRPDLCASAAGSVYIAQRTTGPAARSGVHHLTVRWHRRRHWRASPGRSRCITDRLMGIPKLIGVHRHRRSCTSPTGTPDSQTDMVCITDVDGAQPDRRVCIRSERARNVRRINNIQCTQLQRNSPGARIVDSRVCGRSVATPRKAGRGTAITNSCLS